MQAWQLHDVVYEAVRRGPSGVASGGFYDLGPFFSEILHSAFRDNFGQCSWLISCIISVSPLENRDEMMMICHQILAGKDLI